MRKPPLVLLSWLTVICLLGTGCVSNRAYRRGDEVRPPQPPSVIEPARSDSCDGAAATACITTLDGERKPQSFYLAYVEFDDMGELWSIGNLREGSGSHSQLSRALDVIDRARAVARAQDRDLDVIVFIHGWHNNASAYDEKHKDLGSFRTVLETLSDRTGIAYPDKRPVLVGVFLAWRGQVLAGNKVTSYWNRRDAAVRVGGQSLTETVMRLMLETKGVPTPALPTRADRCDSKAQPANANDHFVVVGHSFGARALEHAIAQPMLSLILERQAEAQDCIERWNSHHPPDEALKSASFDAPADLIVFLNAANDALDMKSTIEALKRSDVDVTSANGGAAGATASAPFMISITSDGDWATEEVMPVAQWLSMPAFNFRKYDRNAAEEGQLDNRNQAFFYRHSAASIPAMRSHIVCDEPVSSPACESAANQTNSWPYFVATFGKDKQKRCFKIEPNAAKCDQAQPTPVWNDTPAYVISVPKTLIPDHTDVFQDGTAELLITIANYYSGLFTPAGAKPTRMRTPSKQLMRAR